MIVKRIMTRNLPLLSYSVALLSVALAFVCSLLLGSFTQPTPLALFYVAVMISAWYGGLAPGLVTTVLSTLVINYLISPYNALSLLNPGNLLRLSVFIVAALLISGLNQAYRVALRREQQLRVEAETARRQTEHLLEHMTDAFVALDLDWRIIYMNAEAEQLNKKPRSTILGKTLWEEWSASVGTQVEHQYRRVMTERISVHFEHRYYAPPDYDVWLEIHAYPSEEGLGVFYRDISSRKQVELVLFEQKQLLEMIALGAPLDQCLAALCNSVSKLNPRARACILLTDAQGLTFPSSITPDFPPSFGQGLKDAPINELCIGTCGEAVYSGQAITCADIANDDRWSREWRDLCIAHGILACHSVPILGIENQPLGSLMLCFDQARSPSNWEYQLATFGIQVASIVIERDRAEAALRRSEEQFRLFVTASSDLVYRMSADWSAMHSLAGKNFLASTETTTNSWLETYIPDEDQPQVLAAIQAAICTKSSFELEHRVIQLDGTVGWAFSRAIPLLDAQGEIVEWFGAASDVTDRKQAELALRESEAIARRRTEEMETLMEVVPTGIWLAHDPDCRRVTVNRAAYKLMRAEPGDPTTATPTNGIYPFKFKLQHNGQEIPAAELSLQKAGRTGQEVVEEAELVFEDGVVHYIYGRAVPLRNEVGNVCGVIGAYVDISERKQAEAEREQLLAREQAAREAAEAANRIKDEFLAIVSHELRSPLNPILGWSKLLRSRQLDPQKTERALEVIERNAQIQAQLINDLLDVSRILRGKLSLDIKPVNLVFTIQAAMETVRLAAEAKSIQINTQFASDVGQVAGDVGRLQQVVWNLLTNAVKFTSEGGRVDIQLESSASHAKITVCDTGKGIPSDFLPYVFEQFRQESSATTRRFGGLGLGLAIVRYLVELHGGTVYADSPGEGQGATFTVRLPLMLHQWAEHQDKQRFEVSLNLQGTRVLMVDDDDNTREFIAFLLELHGANVLAAASATEAITALTQFQPDVLLSDIGMPDMDGYMLMQQIRALPLEQGGSIPAIALTAYAGELDQQQALSVGFERHIAKPIEPQELIQAIKTLCNSTKTR